MHDPKPIVIALALVLASEKSGKPSALEDKEGQPSNWIAWLTDKDAVMERTRATSRSTGRR